jgi:fructose-1-phosphate kinase PfkB-like protein
VSATIYAELVSIIKSAGAKVMLDTSGEPLRLGCEAKPTVIKPNMEEARELAAVCCGADATDADIAAAVLSMGPEQLIISMGKEGALLATNDNLQMVRTPAITERNPIGAGDSMVAGVVWDLNQGKPIFEALQSGIACGAATASLEGTELGSYEMVVGLLAQMRS